MLVSQRQIRRADSDVPGTSISSAASVAAPPAFCAAAALKSVPARTVSAQQRVAKAGLHKPAMPKQTFAMPASMLI
jgi:hypothetical protein